MAKTKKKRGAKKAKPSTRTKTTNRRRDRDPLKRPLTAMQQGFVNAMIEGKCTQAEAAIKAGYSERTAAKQGSQLMDHPRIAAEIAAGQARAQKSAEESAGITIEEALSVVADIARHDPADIFDDDGGVKPIKEWPKSARMALAGFEVEELFTGRGEGRTHVGRLKKAKLAGRIAAVAEVLKVLGGYAPTKREITGKDGGPIETKDVRELSRAELMAIAAEGLEENGRS